ncbi:DUF2336 domain-containing protein [Methylopila turkensis]|uniref:DUF2336 domain-containing protein n=1 Tax=Methylopila turkensis TaxID=1437816 RepID=A0A9W6JQ21_9HYPH|nr:DUF2336 domain-containing protein [Methylopila turkensis]GLK81197.1 hypothetical protein GCM10008174_29380 [Methylopila turkensis]
MIVERYLEWAETAPAHLRAEAAGGLARSYLYGELEDDIRDQVEAALMRILDDPSLAVRCAVAEVLAAAPEVATPLVLALAFDAPDVAEPVLARSPLLTDVELVDLVAQGGVRQQVAIARRARVSAPLCAAIAEVACADACAALLANAGARPPRSAVERIAGRHGAHGGVRDALLGRGDASPAVRQALMRSVAGALQLFVTDRGWLAPDRARRAADEACERGALMIAAEQADAQGFVRLLVDRGEFSAGLALRALLCGNVAIFEAALSVLSGQTPQRVAGFVRDFEGRGFEALYRQASFPTAALPVYRAALAAAREAGFPASRAQDAELSRRMVERALTACDGVDVDVAALRALLRRFATEAARADARRAFQPAARELLALEAPKAA